MRHLFAALGAAALSACCALATAESPAEQDLEFTLVPFVGGDSDVGLGGGFIVSLAAMAPDRKPYLSRLQSTTIATLKTDTGLRVPYFDGALNLDLPHVIPNQLRLELWWNFTREATLKYYGIGNSSRIPSGFSASDEFFRYERMFSTARVRAEYRFAGPMRLSWGVAYTQTSLEIRSDSKLALDLRAGPPAVRRLLTDDRRYGTPQFSYGIAHDTRDAEVSPASGQSHQVRVDLAPGGLPAIPHSWARLNVASALFVTLVPRRQLVLALRALGDALFGEAPFYELTRYDDTSAIGGFRGIRGIPAQRYYGKIKLITNTELRARFFDFELFGKRNTLGAAAFVDAGRLWADVEPHPELDGSGVGLKYGLGAGPRLDAGLSFVLRLDVAWSPDANPLAGYLAAGHVF